MRIAFFGGSFDPPHRGHVAIAQAAADRLALDRVLVAPVGRQPLKDGLSLASYPDRLAMVELAFADDPRCEASRLDAPRPDGTHNYTYETLAALKFAVNKLTPQPGHDAARLFCLLGADSFHSLAHWHRSADLILLCDFIIAARPGYPLAQIASHLPAGVQALEETVTYGVAEIQLAGTTDPAARSRLYLLTDLEEDVSATALREALATQDDAASASMLTPPVAAYIHEHRLYR